MSVLKDAGGDCEERFLDVVLRRTFRARAGQIAARLAVEDGAGAVAAAVCDLAGVSGPR